MELHEGLELLRAIGPAERWLAVLVTLDPVESNPGAAVVNAAPIDHPIDGHPVVAFVGRRGTKLTNLRTNPHATLVFRTGWEWVAFNGPVELAGPDDPHPDIDRIGRTQLMRHIFNAADGHHPDLDAYDQTMADERRCAVLVTPTRIWSNPPHARHREPEDQP